MNRFEVQALDDLLEILDDLNAWETDFIQNIRCCRNLELSMKQRDKLYEIHEKYLEGEDYEV